MQHFSSKSLATGAAVMLSSSLAIGVGFTVADARQSKVEASIAARNYTPASSYTQPPVPTKVAFLGDSFTAGVGTDESKFNRWTTRLSNNNGWLELNYGKGGTNYNTSGPHAKGAAYMDRLTDLLQSQPDIVIVSSAGNDIDEKQELGLEQTFQLLRNGLPDARIIATSPYYRAGEYPAEFQHFGDAIRREVERVGGEYLDIGHPLGNHFDAMDEDEVHPNDAGYRLIFSAVEKALD